MTASLAISTLSVKDGVAILRIDHPPVNALSHAVRRAILDGLVTAQADASVDRIVLSCGGRMFFAGADISELGKPLQPPLLGDIIHALEASTKPVIAAMHGNALGGGLELALACHYRVAERSTRLGLPEVRLGLLPGAGGTQRLPRAIGIVKAAEMILGGDPVGAPAARDCGLVDAICELGQLESAAIAFARGLADGPELLHRVRDRPTDLDANATADCLDAYRTSHPEQFTGYKAPTAICRALQAAATLDFDAGLAVESAESKGLLATPESAALRYLFAAERRTARPATTAEAGSSGDASTTVALAPGSEDAPAVRECLRRTGFEVADGEVHSTDGLGAAIHRELVELQAGPSCDEAVVAEVWQALRKLRPAIIIARGCSPVSAWRRTLAAEAAALGTEGTDGAAIADALQHYGFAADSPLYATLGTAPGDGEVSETLTARLIAALRRTAHQLVDDSVLAGTADADIAAVRGLGWPAWTGGPLHGT